MPHHGERPWQSYYMINTFDGDLGALVENFMDVPHTVFVHDRIFRSSTGRRLRATVELKQQSVEGTYHDDGDKIGMLDWLTNPSREPLRYTDHFYAPNVTRCDYHWGSRSSYLIISQITPLDTRRSRVYTYIAYRFALPAAVLRALKPLLHLYTHSVIQQDVRIMRARRCGPYCDRTVAGCDAAWRAVARCAMRHEADGIRDLSVTSVISRGPPGSRRTAHAPRISVSLLSGAGSRSGVLRMPASRRRMRRLARRTGRGPTPSQ
ncbi:MULTISPECIES: hypothetical protein [Burkholderia cepacia complex]|uniref:hypothetical protein n=1 Tax=Burkholderia cepacia complex TaxID=87882 RepID=UPI0020120C68|nr:hypothetical protein [Burkholderia cenocepacia]